MLRTNVEYFRRVINDLQRQFQDEINGIGDCDPSLLKENEREIIKADKEVIALLNKVKDILGCG